MPSVFLDSNVILYTQDAADPMKRKIAEAWLSRLWRSDALVVSRQVLNEVYSVAVYKRGFLLERGLVRTIVASMEPWLRAPLDEMVVRAAWEIEDRYGVRIWDALLLASANAARCSHFLSEDLNDGQAYGGVTVLNPFRHAPEDVLGPAT